MFAPVMVPTTVRLPLIVPPSKSEPVDPETLILFHTGPLSPWQVSTWSGNPTGVKSVIFVANWYGIWPALPAIKFVAVKEFVILVNPEPSPDIVVAYMFAPVIVWIIAPTPENSVDAYMFAPDIVGAKILIPVIVLIIAPGPEKSVDAYMFAPDIVGA